MFNSVFLTYCVIAAIEATFICIGNGFTVFVFWNQRASLKRACYLLINLAVADLLLGATELIVLGTLIIPQRKIIFAVNITSAIALLLASVSLLCLLVISLERAFAVLWPFRHRAASTRVYIISIIVVWGASLCLATMELLSIYTDKVIELISRLIVDSAFLIALCVIVASYMAIRKKLRNTNPPVEAHNRKAIEQNVKLSKTMFVVIGLSFAFWLPGITVYTIMGICNECVSEILLSIAVILLRANSLVNPIVYSYRMPIFKEAMKKLFKNTA